MHTTNSEKSIYKQLQFIDTSHLDTGTHTITPKVDRNWGNGSIYVIGEVSVYSNTHVNIKDSKYKSNCT